MAKNDVVLRIIATDRTFELASWRGSEVWVGKCIHCNSHLYVRVDGKPISRATIEHIIPRHHGGTDDLENLAMACARCNGHKGTHLDVLPMTDPRLANMIEMLQARRRQRWRPTEGL
jgi:5-methylcytosine-specific restriction endonuclease McrA